MVEKGLAASRLRQNNLGLERETWRQRCMRMGLASGLIVLAGFGTFARDRGAPVKIEAAAEQVVDGDTIALGRQKYRLLELDTPETR